ncbi:MAG: hypothetical protein KatS3mg089_0602 [Patescibacteria group bacterium]|nr:MAG: hypothetical protein KatS3mg089_0602 [Patescibacteria group bacterium]
MNTPESRVQLKRVYDDFESTDGYRVLIDRLWPRGISKQKAKINLWLKDIAPSNELRKWFSHDPQKWEEFTNRYEEELKEKEDIVNSLKEIIAKEKIVTLLFSASDEKHNNAVALKKILKL